jgi:hypothetical protein
VRRQQARDQHAGCGQQWNLQQHVRAHGGFQRAARQGRRQEQVAGAEAEACISALSEASMSVSSTIEPQPTTAKHDTRQRHTVERAIRIGKPLGLLMPNVEMTGAARLHRAASRERSERGRSQG